jgi:D-methionine transport system substrate-binding protein
MTRTKIAALTGLTLASALGLVGCSAGAPAAGPGSADEPVVLEVAAVQAPMTDVVLAAADAVEDGYAIELVEIADYITTNVTLQSGDIDASFSQHEPFMQEFNAGNDGSLTAVQAVYNFTIAFYSSSIDDIADLPEGATIAVPNDSSNLGRALKMLDDAGIVTLDASVDPYEATVADIAENPKDVEFLEVPISSLNTAYEEADLVFQWPSHIAALGLTPQDDGLITELDDRFALQVVVREGADPAAVEALRAAFTSEQVREVIEANETIEVAF